MARVCFLVFLEICCTNSIYIELVAHRTVVEQVPFFSWNSNELTASIRLNRIVVVDSYDVRSRSFDFEPTLFAFQSCPPNNC